MEKRVDLLMAGVQKGSTSTLFRILKDHLGRSGPLVKEAHFFDNETTDWSRPDYAAYHAMFADATRSSLWFEATPNYCFWPSCFDRIRAYNPDIKSSYRSETQSSALTRIGA